MIKYHLLVNVTRQRETKLLSTYFDVEGLGRTYEIIERVVKDWPEDHDIEALVVYNDIQTVIYNKKDGFHIGPNGVVTDIRYW
mgnify:CR=1 FL=1